jgi:hypothetical protein
MRSIVFGAIFSFVLCADATAEEFPLSKGYSGNYLCKMTASAGIHMDTHYTRHVGNETNVIRAFEGKQNK